MKLRAGDFCRDQRNDLFQNSQQLLLPVYGRSQKQAKGSRIGEDRHDPLFIDKASGKAEKRRVKKDSFVHTVLFFHRKIGMQRIGVEEHAVSRFQTANRVVCLADYGALDNISEFHSGMPVKGNRTVEIVRKPFVFHTQGEAAVQRQLQFPHILIGVNDPFCHDRSFWQDCYRIPRDRDRELPLRPLY